MQRIGCKSSHFNSRAEEIDLEVEEMEDNVTILFVLEAKRKTEQVQ